MGLTDDVSRLNWYHTIELPGVTTPGYYDTRDAARSLRWPDLAGKRCLDVGTCDGFWAFEMEHRGAREVVGIDVPSTDDRDYPAPVRREADTQRSAQTFKLARDALGMRAERVPLNVYDISEEALGRFDFAFLGALLLHLRDPVRALMRIRDVTDQLLVNDVIWWTGTRMFPTRPVAWMDGKARIRWWTVNLAGLKRLLVSAGWTVTESSSPFLVPFGEGFPHARTPSGQPLTTRLAFRLNRRYGVPHAWVLARAS